MARGGGCCETTPCSGRAVLDDADSAVAPSSPLTVVPLKAGKSIHLALRSWGSTHGLLLGPYCKYSDYLEVITVAASANGN